MWQFLKAEILYFKRAILFLYAVFGFAYILFSQVSLKLPDEMSTTDLMLPGMIAMAFFFQWNFVQIRRTRYKRWCSHVSLPISINQIGFVQLLLFLFYWTGLIIQFLLFHWITTYFSFDSHLILTLCGVTGIVLIMNVFFGYIGINLLEISDSTRRLFNIPVCKLINISKHTLFLAGLIFYFSIYFLPTVWLRKGLGLQEVYSWIFQSKSGSIIMLLFGLGISIFNIVQFAHRKSYVI